MRKAATVILLILGAPLCASTLFTESEVLQLTLAGPLQQLIDSQDGDPELPFVLGVGETEIPVEVRVRGKSRLRVCDFPPLRLNLERDSELDSAFSGYDKIKLVTHCGEKRRDENVLYDEYLAYRLFALLTDYSYRTRWVRIRYMDNEKPGDVLERQGFLIEPDDAFAERTGTLHRELPGVVYSKLDDAHATLVYVFQYLIGNTDWSLVVADGDDECCHNGDLFEAESGLLLIPYDFDLAGIVHASYAKPDPSLRIRSVRSRLYRGYCTDPERVRAALAAVVGKQSAIMDAAREVPSPSEDDLERRVEYLQEFFAEAEDLEGLLETFQRRCIG